MVLMTWKRGAAMAVGLCLTFLIAWAILNPLVLYHIWGLQQRDVDVRSGEVRERRYGFGLPVYEEISRPAFASSVRELGLGGFAPRWVVATKDSAGLRLLFDNERVEYPGAKALAACRVLVAVHQLEKAGLDTRKEDIEQFLRLMQEGEVDEMDRIAVEKERSWTNPDAPNGQFKHGLSR
jgi:hypothetical protein